MELYRQLKPLSELMHKTHERIMEQCLVRIKYRFYHGSGDDMLTLMNNILSLLFVKESEFSHKFFAKLSSSWNLADISLVNSEALYSFPLSEDGKNEDFLAPRKSEDGKMELEAFFSRLDSGVNDAFILSHFIKGQREIEAKDIPLKSEEDYSALLYAAIRGLAEDAPYEALWPEDMECVDNNGFVITNYRFVKRGDDKDDI